MQIRFLVLSIVAVAVYCQEQAATGKQNQIGIGEWNLVIKTETATGEGCEELGIDQEIRTGLVIEPFENQVCDRANPDCAYVFKWKVRIVELFVEVSLIPRLNHH